MPRLTFPRTPGQIRVAGPTSSKTGDLREQHRIAAMRDASHAVRVLRFGTPATIFRLNRQQAFQSAPFCFGQIAPAQAYLQKVALNQSASAASSLSGLHVTIQVALLQKSKFAAHLQG
jgi:hypothetical protein